MKLIHRNDLTSQRLLRPAVSNSFLLVLLLLLSQVFGQTVTQLRTNYTGNTSWDGSTLKFTSSGTIQYTHNGWDIPANVKKVVIGKNVQVTGRFDVESDVTIEGEDRNTSVLFGTNQQEYASNNGGGDGLSGVRATSGDVTLKNFTLLNSKGFGFTHRGRGFMTVIGCRILDTRGGHHNNSDGIVTWGGGLVKDTYIKTGDDNIKVYGDITVENTELVMIDNAVPIQLGWGDYGSGAKGIFRNLKVTGNSGRYADGKTVISARKGTYNKTLVFDGVTIDNPNASLVNFREGGGNFDIKISNADIQIGQFYDTWNSRANATIEICGTRYGKSTAKTSFKCVDASEPPPSSSLINITDLTAVAADCGSVQLQWSDVDGEHEYRVRRRLPGQTYSILADLPANSTSYTDTEVEPGVSYEYMVRPMQNGTAVKISNVPAVTVPQCQVEVLPEVTSITTACGADAGSITFHFDDTPGRTNIAFSINGGNSYTSVSDQVGSYTFDHLADGVYELWSQWGNGDEPTDLDDVEISCAPPLVEGPVQNLMVSPDVVRDYAELQYDLTQRTVLNIQVFDSQGNKVRDFIEQNAHVGFNATWIKDSHQLGTGVYLVRVSVNGSVVASASFSKGSK